VPQPERVSPITFELFVSCWRSALYVGRQQPSTGIARASCRHGLQPPMSHAPCRPAARPFRSSTATHLITPCLAVPGKREMGGGTCPWNSRPTNCEDLGYGAAPRLCGRGRRNLPSLLCPLESSGKFCSGPCDRSSLCSYLQLRVCLCIGQGHKPGGAEALRPPAAVLFVTRCC
jgi:hypothetical protein